MLPEAKSENETAEEKARRRVIDYWYGISAGAAIGMNALVSLKQALTGIPLFAKVCAEAIDWSKLIPRMDLNAVAEALRHGPWAVDETAVINSPTELWVQLTDAKTKETIIVRAKDVKEGPIQAIRASIAMPKIDGKKIMVNGRLMIDGGIDPLPLKDIIATFPGATEMLILSQVPFKQRHELYLTTWEKFFVGISKVIPNVRSSLLIKKLLGRPEKLREMFDVIRKETGLNIAVLWPPEAGLDILSRDPGLLEAAALQSCEEALKMFGESEKIKDLDVKAIPKSY